MENINKKLFEDDWRKQYDFWKKSLWSLELPLSRNIDEILKKEGSVYERRYFSYLSTIDFISAWEKFIKRTLIQINGDFPEKSVEMHNIFKATFKEFNNSNLEKVISILRSIANSRKHDIEFEENKDFLEELMEKLKEAQKIVFDDYHIETLILLADDDNFLTDAQKKEQEEIKRDLEKEKEKIISANEIQYVIGWAVVMFRRLFEKMVSRNQIFYVTYRIKDAVSPVTISAYVYGKNEIRKLEENSNILILDIKPE